MSRSTPCARVVACLLATTLAACSDPVDVAPPARPLDFTLPHAGALAAPAVDREQRVIPGHAAGDDSSASPDLVRGDFLITGQRTEFAFVDSPTPMAVARASMRHFGSKGTNAITMYLRSPDDRVLTLSQTFTNSSLLPMWQLFESVMRVPVGPCGYSGTAATEHRTSSFAVPPSTLEVMVANASSAGVPAAQSPCRSDLVTSGGGGPKSGLTDENTWYLCTWEVWYDALGNEVARRFLYCAMA